MKLRELKKWVNTLSDEQLKQEVVYNSKDLGLSGVVRKVVKARSNLYYTGEDDPSELHTKKELKEQGYDNEDISGLEIEMEKGQFYLDF